jgi:hypothetical protein
MAKNTSKSPIISRKHYVQESVFTVGLGALVSRNPVTAVDRTVANFAFEVAEGSIVKAIYLEYWVTSDGASSGSFVMSVEKVPGGTSTMTYAQSIALDAYPNKKNILYTTQGITNPRGGVATPFIRQWISIPKGKQRFGLGDLLRINFSGITTGADVCGLAIYKEYQ